MNLTLFVVIVCCAILIAIFCALKLFDLGSSYASIIQVGAIPLGILMSLIGVFACARPAIGAEIGSGTAVYDLIMFGSAIGFFAIGYISSLLLDIVMKRKKTEHKDIALIIAEEMQKQADEKSDSNAKKESKEEAEGKTEEKSAHKTKAEAASKAEVKSEKDSKDDVNVPFVPPLLIDMVGGIISGLAVGFSFALGSSYGLVAATAITLYLIMEKVAMVYRYESCWSRRQTFMDVALTVAVVPICAIIITFFCNKNEAQDATFVAISCGYLLYHTAFHIYNLVKKYRKR